MLRQFLGVLEQLSRQSVILGRIRTAGTRTGDRIRPDAASLTLDEGLRRRTNNLEMASLFIG